VLAAAAPLAVVQEKPAPRPYTRQAREAENISEPSAAKRMTPDEKRPLPGLRSPQSGRDVSVREAGRASRLEPARASEKSGGNRAEKRDPNETVTREKFLSLLQTGERALKNEEPVIKIEK
jgi:hypothetical protein